MKLRIAAAALAVSLMAGAAQASLITFTPTSAPVAQSPPFGPLAQALADNYINFGVDFTYGNTEGYFDDGGGTFAFAGVNGGGNVDLLSDVDGRIVLTGSHTSATTNFLYAEAGF